MVDRNERIEANDSLLAIGSFRTLSIGLFIGLIVSWSPWKKNIN